MKKSKIIIIMLIIIIIGLIGFITYDKVFQEKKTTEKVSNEVKYFNNETTYQYGDYMYLSNGKEEEKTIIAYTNDGWNEVANEEEVAFVLGTSKDKFYFVTNDDNSLKYFNLQTKKINTQFSFEDLNVLNGYIYNNNLIFTTSTPKKADNPQITEQNIFSVSLDANNLKEKVKEYSETGIHDTGIKIESVDDNYIYYVLFGACEYGCEELHKLDRKSGQVINVDKNLKEYKPFKYYNINDDLYAMAKESGLDAEDYDSIFLKYDKEKNVFTKIQEFDNETRYPYVNKELQGYSIYYINSNNNLVKYDNKATEKETIIYEDLSEIGYKLYKNDEGYKAGMVVKNVFANGTILIGDELYVSDKGKLLTGEEGKKQINEYMKITMKNGEKKDISILDLYTE